MKISKGKLKKINILCVNQNLKKISRTIELMYNRKLKIQDITNNQFSILCYIAYYDKITMGLLANKLFMDRTTLSKNLKPLLRKKYIIVTSTDDRRKKNLNLTNKGTVVINKSIHLWVRAQNEIYKKYGKKEIHNLLKILNQLIN
ncbi:MAG: MarR family winged helix-turn-helix transcriptional regulator [Spirochaetia bacterium]|nr:MarR family winged helix-turn-helix transcriptional regulator [Spirochaetia bacterium]